MALRRLAAPLPLRFDCDFNQALDVPTRTAGTIWQLDSLSELHERELSTSNHCFACTAGMGSS